MADPEPAEDEQMGKVEVTTEDERYRCGFCRKKEIKANEWGPMYRLDDVVVHYFCLLFSCGLSQNGEDKEGIEGFLLQDIKKEIRRAQRLKCKYCKKNGANVGCAVNKCRASFHFTCGLANGTLSQFLGQYKSYCPTHKPHREIPSTVEDYECITCMSTVTEKENMVWSRCCKTRVFHKECIQSFAYSAGMFHFKCPHCNARKKFRKAMQLSGIFVPERDASWETEPNAFEDLTKVYSTCDADPCLCPDGKDTDGEGDWKLYRCHACGGGAVHQKCGGVKKSKWICNACAPVVHAVTLSGAEDDGMDDSANDALESDEATSSDETESDHVPNPSDFLQTNSESDASSDLSTTEARMLMNRRRFIHRRPTMNSSSQKNPIIGSFSRESVHVPLQNKAQEFKEKMAKVSRNQIVRDEEFVTAQASSHDELRPNPTSGDPFSTTVKNATSLSKCENSVAKKLSFPPINHGDDTISKATLTLPEIFKLSTNPVLREKVRVKILQRLSGNHDDVNYRKRENEIKSVPTTVAQSNACNNHHGRNENSVTENPFSCQVEQHPVEAKTCSDDDDVVEIIGYKPAQSKEKRSESATKERTYDSNSHKRRATGPSGSDKPHNSRRLKSENSSNSDVSPTKRKRRVVEIILEEDEDDMADFKPVNNTPRVVASKRGRRLFLDIPFQNCSSAPGCRESTLASQPFSSRGTSRSEKVILSNVSNE